MTVAGVMPSPTGNLSNVLGSSFLSPSSRKSLSVALCRKGSSCGAALSVSVAAQQQQGGGKKNSPVVRNVVSTEKRDGFAAISDDDDDYAENFRPPHITDCFDISARPSTFCAKTR